MGIRVALPSEGPLIARLVFGSEKSLFWRSNSWQDERRRRESAAEAVEGATLPLERVHDIHRGDGLALGVLCVRHSVADDILEENLENTAGLFVDEPRDSLHAASARKTTDSWLGDSLDVVSQNFAMTLGSSLSEPFSSLAATRHGAAAAARCEQTSTRDANERTTAQSTNGGELNELAPP